MNACYHPRLSHGITLIEMLVVLLIMGLLVSVTALSMGLAGRSDTDEAARTAEDLNRLFEHAARQAMVTGDVLGVSVGINRDDGPALQWWRWTSDATGRADGNPAATLLTTAMWQQQPDTFMPALAIPANVTLQLSDSQAPGQQNRQEDSRPQVVFMPGRETMPFEMRLLDAGTGRPLARIRNNAEGQMAWSVL